MCVWDGKDLKVNSYYLTKIKTDRYSKLCNKKCKEVDRKLLFFSFDRYSSSNKICSRLISFLFMFELENKAFSIMKQFLPRNSKAILFYRR